MSSGIVEYKIKLPRLVRDGVEYEPTGECRSPRNGEWYLQPGWSPFQASFDYTDTDTYPILRPVWKWPEWLQGWGFAMDDCGNVYWFENEPIRGATMWNNNHGITIQSNAFDVLGIPVPEITDWRVPVLNPNYKPE